MDAFSIPSVIITNNTLLSTSLSKLIIVFPIASKSAVDPLTKYSFSVNGQTSSIGFLLYKTSYPWSNNTVVTFVLNSLSLSFSINELNPPIVSFSDPYIDPLLSIKNTKSKSLSLITVVMFYHILKFFIGVKKVTYKYVISNLHTIC